MCLPKIYTAGKIWHANTFRMLRDDLSFNINARWIDYASDSDIVQNKKDKLWQHCYEDVRDCDAVLLYAKEQEEEQRGALVEIGMAFGMGKPVFAVGKCVSIMPNAISDVAFTHHKLWRWMADKDIVTAAYKITLITGYAKKAA